MSAYRNKPPPPRWRVLYRTPLRQRLRQGAGIAGLAGVALAGLAGIVLAPFLGEAGVALAALGIMLLMTALVLLALVWLTHAPHVVERTIAALSADERVPGRCRVQSEEGRWSLPLAAGELREGQTIRVSFREAAPHDGDEPEREVVEVRVVEA